MLVRKYSCCDQSLLSLEGMQRAIAKTQRNNSFAFPYKAEQKNKN
jgi:hypothetical protein